MGKGTEWGGDRMGRGGREGEGGDGKGRERRGQYPHPFTPPNPYFLIRP